jgi:hypothetical protein
MVIRKIIALGLAMAMSRTVCGNSEDYHVPGDFNSIAEAVASAEEFDTVIVRPGTYFENVVIPHRNFTVKSE